MYEQSAAPNDKIKKALLTVVRHHLTAPPSSTNVERLFSYWGLVATDHRASLAADKLDQILFIRENAPSPPHKIKIILTTLLMGFTMQSDT